MTKTARLEVRIDPELKERLELHAAQNPGTAAEHVRLALENYLNQREDLATRLERLERLLHK